jgi:F-type H+-transporting ATPase subunit a
MKNKLFIFLSFFLLVLQPAQASGWTFFGTLSHAIHVPEHVLTFIFVCIGILGIGFVYLSKVSQVKNALIPDSGLTIRNIIEAYGQFIMSQAKAVIGEEEGPKYFVFLAMLFILLLLNNLTGIIPGFLPPTENLNTTLALGSIAFIYYNVKGCKNMGTINYIKHFCGPVWYMAVLIFPIEIISHLVRPVSLALRLRGNMFGDHIVLGVFSDLVPLLIPIIFLVLGILVSFIQAYVFTMLTMVYIGLATAHHDHGEEHAVHH